MIEYHSNYPRKLKTGSWFASCCGARVRNNTPTRISNSVGIVVYESKLGKELETEKNVVNHITTKNGVFTVMIKKAW